MSEGVSRSPAGRAALWVALALVLLGGALAATTGGPAVRARLHPPPVDLRTPAEAIHVQVDQALRARARALEPRAADAAAVPELVAALDLGADAHTFEDLLDNEDWWAPFRSSLQVTGVVSSGGALVMRGPGGADLAATDLEHGELVRRAREAGTASAVAAVGDRVFSLAAARVTRGEGRAAGAVVVLGAPIEHAAFQSIGEAAAAAIGLSDRARVLEVGGPEALQAGLAQLVARDARGALALDADRAGAAWPVDQTGTLGGFPDPPATDSARQAELRPRDGKLWLLAVFRAPAPAPPQDGLALVLATAGIGLAFGGVVLGVATRRGQAAPEARPPVADAPAVRGAAPNFGGTAVIPRRSALAAPVPVPVSESGAAGAPDGVASPEAMGRYHLLERIGEGGMAEIFVAATHGAEGFVRHFVVKRMHPHLARNRAAIAQFVDEARLQSALIHSNIVPVFDFGLAGDEYFMALEYIHGRDLDRLVRRHREETGRGLSLSASCYIMHSVLEALAYAHAVTDERGGQMHIVHRDIAPGNILVSFRGEVKLTDFGIATAQSRVSRTELGLVKGNTSFMSPEQARGEPVDARSDLFSAGVVLYFCLTGQLMYADNEAVFKRLMRAATGPSTGELIRMEVPPEAARVLKRALAVDPADRYQSARDFARDLAPHFDSGRVELGDIMVQLFPEQRREAR
jgi:hypothetical protein